MLIESVQGIDTCIATAPIRRSRLLQTLGAAPEAIGLPPVSRSWRLLEGRKPLLESRKVRYLYLATASKLDCRVLYASRIPVPAIKVDI